MKSVVEEDLTIEGNLEAKDGSVEVKGKVLGNVTAASVELHQTGKLDGNLTAASVSIEGSYEGILKCVNCGSPPLQRSRAISPRKL